MKIYKLVRSYPNMIHIMWNDMVQYTFNFHMDWKSFKLFLEYICVFEYKDTIHAFPKIYCNLPLYKMKWNSFFLNLLPRLYFNIICKNIVKIFQNLRWDTLKHAHPWKVIQCDTPKGVTIMCFHPISILVVN